MGSATSRVTNAATRPIKEYNLYERAHKAVIKNKYVPSPKHPTTQEFIDKSINELPPEVKEELSRSDPSLHERLRQVYVTSQDITPLQPPPRQHPDRPLPLDRGHHEAPEYGFVEPKVVPYGKVTLKNALQFITAHQNDPETNTVDSISLKHKLDQRLTEQVLHHFGTFRLFVPPQQTAQQQDMLKRLNATPSSLPKTEDLQRRLLGVAMSNTGHDSLPLHQFPEPEPKPLESTLMMPAPTEIKFESTLMTPAPTEIQFNTSKAELGVKDTGMTKYFAQSEVVQPEEEGKESISTKKDGVSRLSEDDVTQTKSDVPIRKNKNADAT